MRRFHDGSNNISINRFTLRSSAREIGASERTLKVRVDLLREKWRGVPR